MNILTATQIKTANAMHALSHKIYLFIDSFVLRHPHFYLPLVTAVALIAYLFLLLFPALVVVSLMNIIDSISAGTGDWATIAIWAGIMIISAFISYRSTQVKLAQPVGLALTEDKAPELFMLVDKLRESYGFPAIQRILITGDYELDIIKTPRWILPVLFSNTLLIGLPVLQCHTPQHMECLIARRIGQFSKQDNKLTNWLYQLRTVWTLYYSSLARQKIFGTELLRGFFFIYAPFYSALSTFAARIDELKADNYAMQIYNHEIITEMITADAVYQTILRDHFWPAVYRISEITASSRPAPHAKMAMAVRNKINDKTLVTLLDDVMKRESEWLDAKPSIDRRVKNIGHDTPRMQISEGKTAVDFYLKNSKNGLINLLDKLWQKSYYEKKSPV